MISCNFKVISWIHRWLKTGNEPPYCENLTEDLSNDKKVSLNTQKKISDPLKVLAFPPGSNTFITMIYLHTQRWR